MTFPGHSKCFLVATMLAMISAASATPFAPVVANLTLQVAHDTKSLMISHRQLQRASSCEWCSRNGRADTHDLSHGRRRFECTVLTWGCRLSDVHDAWQFGELLAATGDACADCS